MITSILFRITAAAGLAVALAACSMGGGGAQLSPGLSEPMNRPGAQLNRVEALFLLNDFRRTRGASAMRGDTVLDATAQSLATAYASSNNRPAMPAGTSSMRLSAGYTTFAEAFSGWRNSPNDAAALADFNVSRVGLGVSYNPASSNGVYWVMLLAP